MKQLKPLNSQLDNNRLLSVEWDGHLIAYYPIDFNVKRSVDKCSFVWSYLKLLEIHIIAEFIVKHINYYLIEV